MRRVLIVLLIVALATVGAVSVDTIARRMVQQELVQRLPDAPNRATAELAGIASSKPRLFDDDGGALRRLAIAAVGKNQAVAGAAQQEIESLLESGRPSNRTLRQRRRLAAALRSSGPGLAPDWTADIARRLVRLASQQNEADSAETARGLLADCEAVLWAAANARRPAPRVAPGDPRPNLASRRVPAPLFTDPATAFAPPVAVAPLRPGPQATPQPRSAASTRPPAPLEPRSFVPPESVASARPQPPAATGAPEAWNPNWSSPPRPVPATPSVALPVDLPPAPPEDLALLTDRELLRRFLPIARQAAAAPAAVGPARPKRPAEEGAREETLEDRLRRAVVQRGLGGVATRHVAMLLSENEADRLRLVDLLLTTGSDGAARFLLMLARDPSPAVRRGAIRALGSASDPRLVQAAWRLARDDEDPRVAQLVNELQVR